jgi:multidrug efflux pump subunit AcrA (membrane-fusion protein)
MNSARRGARALFAAGLAAAFALLAAGCARKAPVALAPLSDAPRLGAVGRADFTETVPATGVVDTDGDLKLDLGQWEARQVRPGQDATATVDGMQGRLSGRVGQLLRDAAGGGQSLVWIVPREGGPALRPGSFVEAAITTRVFRGSLAVPLSALFVLDGRTVVLVPNAGGPGGAPPFVAAPVDVGVRHGGLAQVLSGLKAGQRVVVHAGIGYLYPDFKAEGAG